MRLKRILKILKEPGEGIEVYFCLLVLPKKDKACEKGNFLPLSVAIHNRIIYSYLLRWPESSR